MPIKIKGKRVKFVDLMLDETLNPQESYDLLNVDFKSLEKYLDLHYYREDNNNIDFKYYLSKNISLLEKEKEDTFEEVVKTIKSNCEKKLEREVENLKMHVEIKRGFFMKLILRNLIKEQVRRLKLAERFLNFVLNMTWEEFEEKFIEINNHFDENIETFVPEGDFFGKTIYYIENGVEVNKGIIYPSPTRFYGAFKNTDGTCRTDFYFYMKDKSNEVVLLNTQLDENGDFVLQSRSSWFKTYENKEEALKEVEDNLSKAWEKFKKRKKDLNF